MSHTIKTVYVVHHSHTDIGYTDLQERVVQGQVNYIRSALRILDQPENENFRWNCETWFCVEEFLKTASPQEAEAFFARMREGKIGFSANYLNFCDLLDTDVLSRRLDEVRTLLDSHGVPMKTSMFADVNGISMGHRDALIDHGVEFLYTNIHCHHGMYPLYQNQTAYWWENAAGKRLLVWNGEHYNLGNVLGLKPNRGSNFMTQNFFGDGPRASDAVEVLHQNLEDYLTLCEENGYPYDFMITSVSGVFSDNAPPEPEILRVIEEHARRYPEGTRIRMVSLQELYAAIAPKLHDSPVYRGDLNDWWANGVGSTPAVVKHYLAARRNLELARRLDPGIDAKDPATVRQAEDALLLYAEHTWGHSASITDPYEGMVPDLDMRKNGYASTAHEAAAKLLGRIAREQGDILRYYSNHGTVEVVNPSYAGGKKAVEFYVETLPAGLPDAWVKNEAGEEIPCQVSPHPRGRRITFVEDLEPGQRRRYTYGRREAKVETNNTRQCYVGAERVRDIVNDYDPVTYRLPYGFENPWFRLEYQVGRGLTSLYDKTHGRELLTGEVSAFTPIYEVTPVRPGLTDVYEERRLLGRNIRGQHATQTPAQLQRVVCEQHGAVFTTLRLVYTMPGTIHCDVVLKLYEAMPRIDVTVELGKTLSTDIESVYLPLTLAQPGELWVRKGGREAFRPGVDQLPGTGMEYTMSDDGLALLDGEGGVLLGSPDVPLLYFGQLRHHPIRLCENDPADNRRPVYSWMMNNTWETNFKLDLSGCASYRYTLRLTRQTDPDRALDELHEDLLDPCARIVE